ncbi:MAG: hypothetical protein WCU80_06880 [Paludibacteraceae bacterium]
MLLSCSTKRKLSSTEESRHTATESSLKTDTAARTDSTATASALVKVSSSDIVTDTEREAVIVKFDTTGRITERTTITERITAAALVNDSSSDIVNATAITQQSHTAAALQSRAEQAESKATAQESKTTKQAFSWWWLLFLAAILFACYKVRNYLLSRL